MEKELFMTVFNYLKEKYPNQQLEMKGTVVYRKGEPLQNIDGFNLLFNLYRLTNEMSDEWL